jgi:hypothetical protein
VKILQEFRITSVRIVDACVVVIAQRDSEDHLDPKPLGGHCQTIEVRVVGLHPAASKTAAACSDA